MELSINNKTVSVDALPDESLLNVLRNDLDLTGTKYGCGEGACGACTVHLDGVATRSCITKLSIVEGKRITTIEGLSIGEKLHPVQQIFLDVDVFQCAYCASGMIMSAVSLLGKNPYPSEGEIVHVMQGNICRCGGYPRVVEAIKKVSKVAGQTNKSRKQ